MTTVLDAVLEQRMQRLRDAKLLRHQRVVTIDPSRVLCSNDYLGLAGDGSLVHTHATDDDATSKSGSGASRLISGTHAAHVALEHDIAKWMNKEAAIYFATGYQANVGTLSALAKQGDVIFSDALNHASIIDGIRLAGVEKVIYPHVDMHALEQALKTTPCDGMRIIVTDGVFSMDGDAAPLHTLVRLKHTYNAILVVDEAHTLGVLGAQGRGLADEMGLLDEIDVIVGPCGKSFGATGAFVVGSSLLREYLYNRARSFVFSTAPPPWSAELTRRAIPYLIQGERQQALHVRMNHLASALTACGFWEGEPVSAIFPVVVGSEANVLALASSLLEEDIFVHPIRPPTVPAGTSRLRVTVTAVTPLDVINRFVAVLNEACHKLGVQPQRWSHGTIEKKER